MITARILCGVISTSLCNVTAFTSIQSGAHFSPRSFVIDGIRPLCKVSSRTSQRLSMGLWFRLCGGESVCENDVTQHFFTTPTQCILALPSWNISVPSEKKKSIDLIVLSTAVIIQWEAFSYLLSEIQAITFFLIVNWSHAVSSICCKAFKTYTLKRD